MFCFWFLRPVDSIVCSPDFLQAIFPLISCLSCVVSKSYLAFYMSLSQIFIQIYFNPFHSGATIRDMS